MPPVALFDLGKTLLASRTDDDEGCHGQFEENNQDVHRVHCVGDQMPDSVSKSIVVVGNTISG